jgi:membrane fusion protein
VSRAAGLFRPEALAASRRRLWGELLLVQPPGTTTLVALVVGFLAGAVLLLAWGEFTRTERVRGYLVPDGGVLSVRVPQAGVVARVLVAEGDRVAAGAALVEIHDPRASAEGPGPAAAALASLDAQLARLDARARAERSTLARSHAADRDALERLEARIASTAAQADHARARLALAERARERVAALVAAGHLPRQQLELADAERHDLARAAEALVSGGHALAQEAVRLRERIDGHPERLAAALRAVDDARDALRRERITVDGRRAVWLRAPRAGRVASLSVVPGEPAVAGRTLMTLMAEDAAMSAVLLVPSRAAGFVRPGQQVRLLYDAFPFTRFGVHPGEVVSVSRSILAPAEVTGPTQVNEPVYKVRVRPRSAVVRAYGEDIPLRPGMSLEADVELETRALWRWVLDPLLALRGRL